MMISNEIQFNHIISFCFDFDLNAFWCRFGYTANKKKRNPNRKNNKDLRNANEALAYRCEIDWNESFFLVQIELNVIINFRKGERLRKISILATNLHMFNV